MSSMIKLVKLRVQDQQAKARQALLGRSCPHQSRHVLGIGRMIAKLVQRPRSKPTGMAGSVQGWKCNGLEHVSINPIRRCILSLI
jgi:hypothetical protein